MFSCAIFFLFFNEFKYRYLGFSLFFMHKAIQFFYFQIYYTLWAFQLFKGICGGFVTSNYLCLLTVEHNRMLCYLWMNPGLFRSQLPLENVRMNVLVIFAINVNGRFFWLELILNDYVWVLRSNINHKDKYIIQHLHNTSIQF